MTRGDLPGLQAFGRPIKPVAFGFTITMTTLFLANVFDVSQFGRLVIGDVIGVGGLIGAVLLSVGWFGRRQRFAEAGLLVSTLIYVMTASFLFLLKGFDSVSGWLALGTAVIAGGAFVLEAWDDFGGAR